MYSESVLYVDGRTKPIPTYPRRKLGLDEEGHWSKELIPDEGEDDSEPDLDCVSDPDDWTSSEEREEGRFRSVYIRTGGSHRHTHQRRMFDHVVPPLRKHHPNIQTIHLGSEPRVFGDDSWVVHCHTQDSNPTLVEDVKPIPPCIGHIDLVSHSNMHIILYPLQPFYLLSSLRPAIP
jgi:hypothetical protein